MSVNGWWVGRLCGWRGAGGHGFVIRDNYHQGITPRGPPGRSHKIEYKGSGLKRRIHEAAPPARVAVLDEDPYLMTNPALLNTFRARPAPSMALLSLIRR